MNICRNRHLQILPYSPEQTATCFYTNSTKRFDRSPIGLVVGRLKNPGNFQSAANLVKVGRNRVQKLFRFNYARPKNVKRRGSADLYVPEVEALHHLKNQ